jgi:Domain of unknown function (DUF4214)
VGIARILRGSTRRLNAKRYRRELTVAYRAVLHREPDPEGLTGYLGNVLAGRQSISDVTEELLGSAERLGLEPQPADLVGQLYQVILGRDPDPDGLASHIQRIDSRQATIADLVRDFVESDEFANRVSVLPAVANRLARLLIVGMTGRDPGEATVRNYSDAMTRGYALDAFIQELRQSPEFGGGGSSEVPVSVNTDAALLAVELIAVHLGDEGRHVSLPPLPPAGAVAVPARTMASLLHTLAMLGRSPMATGDTK